jgi:hypothetical protein
MIEIDISDSIAQKLARMWSFAKDAFLSGATVSQDSLGSGSIRETQSFW